MLRRNHGKIQLSFARAREAIFPICKAMRIGVVVMKPFCWLYDGIPFMKFGPVKGEEYSQYTPASSA
ncbi:MAG: hypothetical protein QXK89_02210 [Candidatus Bathyarchaeia archaeon]